MTYWNYRAVAWEDAEFGETVYQLHEVYYDDDGTIEGWTEKPVTFAGDTPEELATNLIRAALSVLDKEAVWPKG